MARSDAVWGIDIGNASLKALRCRPRAADELEALAFDFIDYPRILSQPGSDPAELISEALTQFLSRNTVRGDRVAVSVAGQNGLARFIKLPPVEAKKIPDIVRYEARQQIPFDLNDVVWDYQRMGVGAEEEGFALETEIGLFAMKRDQVFRALEPFRKAGIEVDAIQLTPLALYNFVAFDQLTDLPSPEQYDSDNPPESVVVLSMGTDATDLVITNGFRVWQRSVPLGGNHFTKALTKELKLTFAKAEHLKRNASAAEDPKAVFQAMRPVFNDLLTEIQRSIGYFTTIDRNAKIGKLLALGNGMKLPGLRRYLSQNLGHDVVRLENFRALIGAEVIDAPVFKDNQLSFGVCYGLALQAMGKGVLRTNLLPKEILKDRMIRAKKPWAVAAAALVLLACTLSFAGYSRALGTVEGDAWQSAEDRASSVGAKASGFKSESDKEIGSFKTINTIGSNLTENVEGRVVWQELLRAISACLPSDPEGQRPDDVSLRNELHVTNVDTQKIDNVAPWFTPMKANGWYRAPGQGATAPKSGEGADGGDSEGGASEVAGPSGPGWIVRITGYHYHNQGTAETTNIGAEYVRRTLVKNLEEGKVLLPKFTSDGTEEVTMKELGIGYPCLVNPERPREVLVPIEGPETETGKAGAAEPDNPDDPEGGGQEETPSVAGAAGAKTSEKRLRCDFVVEFVWVRTPPSVRQQKKAEEAQKKAEEAAAAQGAAEEGQEPQSEG